MASKVYPEKKKKYFRLSEYAFNFNLVEVHS